MQERFKHRSLLVLCFLPQSPTPHPPPPTRTRDRFCAEGDTRKNGGGERGEEAGEISRIREREGSRREGDSHR